MGKRQKSKGNFKSQFQKSISKNNFKKQFQKSKGRDNITKMLYSNKVKRLYRFFFYDLCVKPSQFPHIHLTKNQEQAT
jgi:hypothetical protein